MIYSFTNRRRGKDAIIAVLDRYGTDGIIVFVNDGVLYVYDALDRPGMEPFMYFAHKHIDGTMEQFFVMEQVTEMYRGDGIIRLRV